MSIIPLLDASRRRNASTSGGVTRIFHEDFAGGVTHPTAEVTYSIAGMGDLDYSEIVAAGDVGAQVKAGFTHSLRSTATASTLGVLGSRPQINMSLATARGELGFLWDVHIPSNYTHRNNYTPPSTPEADNNKLWIMWGGPYSSGTVQAGVETLTNGVSNLPSDGISRTLPKMRNTLDGLYTEIESLGQIPLIGAGLPVVPGRFNLIGGWVRKASSIGATDGAIAMMVDGVTIFEAQNLPLGASDVEKFAQGINRMYLLGEQNAGYAEDTVFHTQTIDLFDGDPRLAA